MHSKRFDVLFFQGELKSVDLIPLGYSLGQAELDGAYTEKYGLKRFLIYLGKNRQFV